MGTTYDYDGLDIETIKKIQTINTDAYLRVSVADDNIIYLDYNLTNIRLLFKGIIVQYNDGVTMSCTALNYTNCLIVKINSLEWDGAKFGLQRGIENVKEDDLQYFLENIDVIIPCTHREDLSEDTHPLLQVYNAVLDK